MGVPRLIVDNLKLAFAKKVIVPYLAVMGVILLLLVSYAIHTDDKADFVWLIFFLSILCFIFSLAEEKSTLIVVKVFSRSLAILVLIFSIASILSYSSSIVNHYYNKKSSNYNQANSSQANLENMSDECFLGWLNAHDSHDFSAMSKECLYEILLVMLNGNEGVLPKRLPQYSKYTDDQVKIEMSKMSQDQIISVIRSCLGK